MITHRFVSVAEARYACRNDRLATVYRSATSVFVATSFGTGTFPIADWDPVFPVPETPCSQCGTTKPDNEWCPTCHPDLPSPV